MCNPSGRACAPVYAPQDDEAACRCGSMRRREEAKETMITKRSMRSFSFLFPSSSPPSLTRQRGAMMRSIGLDSGTLLRIAVAKCISNRASIIGRCISTKSLIVLFRDNFMDQSNVQGNNVRMDTLMINIIIIISIYDSDVDCIFDMVDVNIAIYCI